MNEPSVEYDIGLSFASEQRDYVERVAEELDYRGIKVFYDAMNRQISGAAIWANTSRKCSKTSAAIASCLPQRNTQLRCGLRSS